jgi:SOUL heme-binding protein
MEFVLPSGVNSATAPVPKSEKITIKDVPAEVLAVREFPGFATDGEVSRQRAMLEDALLADGVIYDNLSFKVFQYNPPYTLPWLRRNEVTLSIDMVMSDIVVPEEINPELIFSPEAGE